LSQFKVFILKDEIATQFENCHFSKVKALASHSIIGVDGYNTFLKRYFPQLNHLSANTLS